MNILAFILSSLAGFSTILGFLFIYLKIKEDKIIPYALGFSIGIMLFISIFDLLINSYKYFHNIYISSFSLFISLFFFILGLGITLGIKSIIPKSNNSLYCVGILSMITIILHNIPEGIITYLTTSIETKSGIILALSIALHNIPEGICIAIPIYYSTNSKLKALKYVLVSAISEPIGAITAYLFLRNISNDLIMGILLALVSGIMILVAFKDILKEGLNYSLSKVLISFLLGILLALMTHLLF